MDILSTTNILNSILSCVSDGKTLSNKEATEVLRISPQLAAKKLNQLCDADKLVRRRISGKFYYSLSEDALTKKVESTDYFATMTAVYTHIVNYKHGITKFELAELSGFNLKVTEAAIAGLIRRDDIIGERKQQGQGRIAKYKPNYDRELIKDYAAAKIGFNPRVCEWVSNGRHMVRV